MKEVDEISKRVKQAWLAFEDDGSIESYLSYQQLCEQLAALEAESEPAAVKRH
jgi:hypothetical protein